VFGRLALTSLVFVTINLARAAIAENAKQQLNEIVRDTQKQGNRAGRITLVWWLPPEFWRAALAASGSLPADKIQEMVSSISDVNVFTILDGKIGPLSIDYVSEGELVKSVSVIDGQGKPLALIPEAKQSAATKNLLAIMRPVLANMLGEFGKHVSFFVSEGKSKNGSRAVDPGKPGSLIVKVNVEEFRWRLPLGSLLPRRVCPKCSETFPGNYEFCPFDATPLKEKPATAK
jgi:hypothetical protein